MRLTMYNDTSAARVRPGQLVDDERGPVLIDEVRNRIDDDGPSVSLLGKRQGGTSTRREHLRFHPSETVRLVPAPPDQLAVWANIISAIRAAHEDWVAASDADPGGPAPWEVSLADNTITVRLDGVPYQVTLVLTPDAPTAEAISDALAATADDDDAVDDIPA